MGDRAVRVQIGNLATGEDLDAQYNPDEFEDELEADYEKVGIPGLPHELLQYKLTKSPVLTMDFAFEMEASAPPADTENRVKGFIEQFFYPSRSAGSVATGAPPQALLIWPNVYTMVVRFLKRKVKGKRFALDGRNVQFVISITLVEDREQRLASEDVRESAGIRSGQ